ncbi:recombinase family protein [Bacillus velezensis]|uniref:recombinase family protein n=1 Tax=Bacillus velezensis TaxID=492670 RepID=UPI000BA63B0D|nr:recombinase family protein [Bacillus velezensis]MEC2240188.1 recombinase family protein [Bacillus velezensis]MED3676863.1 recombinase family protein [Bacillus velezensis]PAK29252.1 recombinase family protein [Bacillus velezensis]
MNLMDENTQKNVGIYVRVSTEEQAKEGYSISAQKEKLKAYCISQGWDSYKFYIDEGKSAKDIHRPSLELMLRHIEQGIIDTVLVYRLDRLTRSVRDLYSLLDYFDKYQAVFRSATEVYDTGSATGRLFITLVAAMAQWERENLGERVKMGQVEKARQGQFSAPAPFGFTKEGEDLVKNPEEGKVLLDMIDKIKKGYSLRELADYLDESDALPRRGYKWHIASILVILKNPVLYGEFRWSGEIHKGSFESYISKKEFEQLQKMLHDRQNFKRRETTSIFIFQAKIKCPNCGNRLTCERSIYFRKKDNKDVESNHYRCQACALNKKPAIGISEKKFEKALMAYMKNANFKREPKIPHEKQQDYDKLHKKIISIEKQRKKYQKAWSMELMTDQEFEQLMTETKEALQKATAKLEQNDLHPIEKPLNTERAKELAKMFRENWSVLTGEEKRQIVQELIKHIEFEKKDNKAKILDIHFY